jgi:hypothetical protein
VTTPTKRFSFDANYDFTFRPATYWPDIPTSETDLSNIQGSARRRLLASAVEGAGREGVDESELDRETVEFLFKDQLDEEARQAWGAVHPALMGGEYLPETEDDEVEVARIELESVTADVIQLRAWLDEGQISYHVVDEYETTFTIQPDLSEKPLTLGELIELIDAATDEAGNTGLTDIFRDLNNDGSLSPEELEELGAFVWVTSAFYPQLEPYYADRAQAWVEEKKLEPRKPKFDYGAQKMPVPRPDDIQEWERRKRVLSERIRKSGKRYAEVLHTFETYGERGSFISDLDGERDERDSEAGFVFYLSNGGMFLDGYSRGIVYEEIRSAQDAPVE